MRIELENCYADASITTLDGGGFCVALTLRYNNGVHYKDITLPRAYKREKAAQKAAQRESMRYLTKLAQRVRNQQMLFVI